MMIYDVAMVEDHGSYWAVNGVSQNSFDSVDKENKYLKLSAVSAKLIQDAILAGNEVRIIKPLRSVEVLPSEIKVLKVNVDEIETVRDSHIKRVRMLINPELAATSGMTFYSFICLNNELADKGYFITDSNRESKYLSILETGNEKLIAQLEEYLNCRDEISRVSHLYKQFEKMRKEIKNESSPEKIQKLADDFMQTFYARF